MSHTSTGLCLHGTHFYLTLTSCHTLLPGSLYSCHTLLLDSLFMSHTYRALFSCHTLLLGSLFMSPTSTGLSFHVTHFYLALSLCHTLLTGLPLHISLLLLALFSCYAPAFGSVIQTRRLGGCHSDPHTWWLSFRPVHLVVVIQTRTLGGCQSVSTISTGIKDGDVVGFLELYEHLLSAS